MPYKATGIIRRGITFKHRLVHLEQSSMKSRIMSKVLIWSSYILQKSHVELIAHNLHKYIWSIVISFGFTSQRVIMSLRPTKLMQILVLLIYLLIFSFGKSHLPPTNHFTGNYVWTVKKWPSTITWRRNESRHTVIRSLLHIEVAFLCCFCCCFWSCWVSKYVLRWESRLLLVGKDASTQRRKKGTTSFTKIISAKEREHA